MKIKKVKVKPVTSNELYELQYPLRNFISSENSMIQLSIAQDDEAINDTLNGLSETYSACKESERETIRAVYRDILADQIHSRVRDTIRLEEIADKISSRAWNLRGEK